MVGEIVFHLGDCKTGTTSIQRTLAAGKVTSAGRSVIYPTRSHHIPLASTLNRAAEAKFADKRFSDLAQKLQRSNADTAIVSAETFEFVDPRKLEQMIDRHLAPWKGKMRFISYVRPHADRMVSGFAERTKQGWHTGSMDDLADRFDKKGLLHFAPRFQRWRDTFGEAHSVRPMVRSLLRDGDVVNDFLHFVFEGESFSYEPVPVANESLTLSDLAALRRMHGVLERRAGSAAAVQAARRTFGWNLAILLSDLPKPEDAGKPRLHEALAHRLIETYREDAETVDRAFLGFEPGTGPLSKALHDAPARAVPAPQPIAAETYFEPAALRMIDGTAELFARMLYDQPELMAKAMRVPGPGAVSAPSRPQNKGKNKGKPGPGRTPGAHRAARLKGGTGRKAQPASAAGRLARRLPKGLRRKLSPLRRYLP